jgi:hypothetical protein
MGDVGLRELRTSINRPPVVVRELRNRSAAHRVCGVLQIVIGCFCGLFALTVAVATAIGRQGDYAAPDPLKTTIPAVVCYVAISAAFIWLGIGSILGRRWAWSLTVVSSWLWLLGGVVRVAGLLFHYTAPAIKVSLQHPEVARATIGDAVILATIIGIFLLLPVAFLVIYRQPSVRAAFGRLDPHVRWTDRCPLPVLAVSVALASFALGMCLAISGPVLVLFGEVISGPLVAATMLFMALVAAGLAWGTYRLSIAAWWGTLLLAAAFVVSSVVTLWRAGVAEKICEKTATSAAQIQAFRKAGLFEPPAGMRWLWSLVGAAILCYLLYVRRYFRRRNGGD